MAIIKSLLDTDLYKFTMWQTALNQFPTTDVVYEFKCRNDATWTEDILRTIKNEINNYCTLRFQKDEIKYLRSLGFFKEGFLSFLSLYKANRDHIKVELKENTLSLTVTGPWFLTIPFEVPVLAIINEVYFQAQGFKLEALKSDGLAILDKKISVLKKYSTDDFTIADFGTRRRFSFEWQNDVIKKLNDLNVFVGTSNVYFAKKYKLKAIGTMAHEFLMIGQAQDDVPLIKFQKKMLQSWVDEYRGDLGIALTDTVGLDAFLQDFDLYFAKLYDGLRHDSGDPLWWAEKVIAHYRKLNIDPRTKTLVFSDGLSPQKAVEIAEALKGQCRISFGIGTNLTNDFTGLDPLQIVMKIVNANGQPVAKVSDSPGKGMCKDEDFLKYLMKIFGK